MKCERCLGASYSLESVEFVAVKVHSSPRNCIGVLGALIVSHSRHVR